MPKRVKGPGRVSDVEEELKNLKEKGDKKYPSVSAIWERKWESVITMFSHSADIRCAIYTMPLQNWTVCLNQFEIMYNNK